LSNYCLVTILLGLMILAVACAYSWWRCLLHTKLLISIAVVWSAIVTGTLFVWHETRGFTWYAVVDSAWEITVIFAPPILSGVSIYYSWPRIAKPVHYFFLSVISLWAVGFSIFFAVLLIGIGWWQFPGFSAVADPELHVRMTAALVAFLAISVAILGLLRYFLGRPAIPEVQSEL
jgi:hypothetical protein